MTGRRAAWVAAMALLIVLTAVLLLSGTCADRVSLGGRDEAPRQVDSTSGVATTTRGGSDERVEGEGPAAPLDDPASRVKGTEATAPQDKGAALATGQTLPSDVPEYFSRCGVVVRDRSTGMPLAGVRVMIASEQSGMRFGGVTDVRGEYTFPLKDLLAESLKRDGREEPVERFHSDVFDVVARLPGCRPATRRIERTEQSVEILLDPETDRVRPGRVEGVILAKGGTPLAGRVLLEGYDEFGDYSSQWVVAGAGGSYALESMTPGKWRLRLFGSTGYEHVVVPDGGTVNVNLKSTGAEGGPQAGKAEETTRSVRVTGLPVAANANASIRAEVKPRQFFRATVHDGVAEFPELPIGDYRFVLETPGAPDRGWDVTIGGEPETVTVRFPSR